MAGITPHTLSGPKGSFDLFGDTGAIFNSVISNSYYGMLLFFGHFNLSKNIKQTAVINTTRQCML